ncbi:MAG: hypothetical protein GKS00_23640 [Alphaproteobacteria bacterium]|nr:hypothetical protein [Alphaproteobacteria bacterium]
MRTEPVTDASVWTGAELEADRSWEYVLTDAHCAELEAALRGVKERGLALPAVTKEAFPLSSLGPVAANIAGDLKNGCGFALMRRFPVEGYDYADIELMYWGLCMHIGTGITQNGEAGFIHYVTDGALRPSQGKRGVGFPKESKLHVDLMDVVSLLCVKQAPDDPPSRVASTAAIYNAVLAQRPDGLARLYEGFEWGRMDEQGVGETATSGYKVPFFSEKNGQISCQYNRAWIRNGDLHKGREMSQSDSDLLDFVDAVADEVRLEFPFQPGDVQFCNNYTVLHGRAAHDVVPEEDRKRVLLRIWLDMQDVRAFADEAIIRYGIGRHGQLGWSADDIQSGRNETARARRDDGAIRL